MADLELFSTSNFFSNFISGWSFGGLELFQKFSETPISNPWGPRIVFELWLGTFPNSNFAFKLFRSLLYASSIFELFQKMIPHEALSFASTTATRLGVTPSQTNKMGAVLTTASGAPLTTVRLFLPKQA